MNTIIVLKTLTTMVFFCSSSLLYKELQDYKICIRRMDVNNACNDIGFCIDFDKDI